MVINQKAISTSISLSEYINNMETRLAEMKSRSEAVEAQPKSVHNSYSWRITAPLRFGLKLLKKLKK